MNVFKIVLMVLKVTHRAFEAKTANVFLLVAFLFSTLSVFSQTITSVIPTRITSGSEVTVLGTGFLSVDVNDVAITDILIEPGSVEIVSDTEIIFTISNVYITTSGGVLVTLPTGGNNDDIEDQLGKSLTIGNGSGSVPIIASDLIDYIKPTLKEYRNDSEIEIDEIFTDWDYNGNGYYRSNWWDNADESTYPSDRHDLLAFTIDGVTYSTGVNDALLDLKSISYTAQNYQAYSTNGITGFPHRDNYLLMADEIDGAIDATILNAQVSATAYDVIIDGVNGLDLGTGIANFNKEASVRFFSGNGIFGAVNDNIPDLVITQIANSNGNLTDVYYYADLDGNIIGRPVRLRIDSEADRLFKWGLDLYNMNNSVPYDISYPTSTAFQGGLKRLFRMVGLKLSDFEIDNNSAGTNYIGDINNINMLAGGSADMAFMAYNKSAFDIKSPKIDKFPLSRNICRLDTNNSIEFSALGVIEGGATLSPVDPNETIEYQWYKDYVAIAGETSSSYTLSGVISSSDLGSYKVRVSNGYGAVDLPFTLKEGGTPTFWNGTTWELPPAFITAGITVDDDERNLIFNEDYNEDVDLEGCDCRVLRDREVTIKEGKTLKLYKELVVEQDLDIYDENNIYVETIPAGQITFKDDASLVQTKAVITNANSGAIVFERATENLNISDYIYWSSPVDGFDIGHVPGSNSYSWDVNAINSFGTRGNWSAASASMDTGIGYIKRVPSDVDFVTSFVGVPNNGAINVVVEKSDDSGRPDPEDSHWNLIGNPYPSSIDASTFLAANVNLEGNVQIWTRGEGIIRDNSSADPYYQDFGYNYGDEYVTYNGMGATPEGFDGKIASGQGFFVQVLDSSPATSNVVFNNAMRYDGAEETYDNSQFYRSGNSEVNTDGEVEKQLIWLGLVDESNTSKVALVGYADGATNGIDRLYDAQKIGEGMSIYSVLEDKNMIIQGRSYPFEGSDTIAIGVELPEDGIFKIAIDNVKGSVFENDEQGIYLEDTYLNVVHDLRDTPYSFTGVEGVINDRFVLRYTPSQLLSVAEQTELDVFMYIKDKRLYVKSLTDIESIVLFDITGKQVATYKLDKNVSREFNTSFQYPRGAYMALLKMESGFTVGKKIMN
ncbi:hypothetical protein [Winogradskyella ludwigii]|uniref:hypothetical protein n=1 Tax=Winogradskyella ludwigii TaxID=2686076 RepID=UPI0015C9AA58|nr:hypothetical protein [Winogradskyella ludwigii]